MNCSDKDEYMRRIVELQTALESRGYPRPVLHSPAYDAGKRTAFFTKILQRQRQPQESGRPGDVIVFKTARTRLAYAILGFELSTHDS